MAHPIKPYYPTSSDGRYVVRLYNGSYWTDYTGVVCENEALRVWGKKTENGTRWASYTDGDYFSIFPAATKMIHNGDTEQP